MRIDFREYKSGWWSYVEDGTFCIGDSWPHELYRGEYKGNNTPYLLDLKEDDPKQYYRIAEYFCDRTFSSIPERISASEKFVLKNRITEIMRASVTDEYVRSLLKHKHPNTHRAFMDDVIDDVLENSDWETERFYCDVDIRLAIGRVLTERLALNVKN